MGGIQQSLDQLALETLFWQDLGWEPVASPWPDSKSSEAWVLAQRGGATAILTLTGPPNQEGEGLIDLKGGGSPGDCPQCRWSA
jgi:hypothetical protein